MHPSRSPLVLVLAIASSGCAESRAEPSVKRTAHQTSQIQLEAAAPYAIDRVRIVPFVESYDRNGKAKPLTGSFEVEYRATRDRARTSDRELNVRIKCRVAGRNLVMVKTDSASNVQNATYWPDPFTELPDACELEWSAKDKIIATACYRDDALANGACPSRVFARATVPAGFVIDVHPVTSPPRFDHEIPPIHVNQHTIQIQAIVTVAKPIGSPLFKIRCEQGKLVAKGQDEVGQIDPGRLRADESEYTWMLTVPLDNDDVTSPSRCQLDVVAGAKRLGVFCINVPDGETQPAACANK